MLNNSTDGVQPFQSIEQRTCGTKVDYLRRFAARQHGRCCSRSINFSCASDKHRQANLQKARCLLVDRHDEEWAVRGDFSSKTH